MKRIAVLAALALGALANADFLYMMDDSSNTLQTIDLNTLAISNVGGTGAGGDFGDLSWGGDGKLYWLAGRNNPSLYTLNTATGAATLVGSHGVTDMFGLGFNYANGTMYSSQFSGGNGVYSMNTSTGAATFLTTSGGGLGGMTYVPGVGLLATQDGAGSFWLVAPNGTQTLYNAGAGFIDDCDIAYDPVRNVVWCADWSGNLFKYDLNAGFARTTVLTGLGPHDGLEYQSAVPEPVSMIALGAGLAALAARRRRK